MFGSSDVKWADGSCDSDEWTSLGVTARAFPDGRYEVVASAGAVVARGQAGDMDAARRAALEAHWQKTTALREHHQHQERLGVARRRTPAEKTETALQRVEAKTAHVRAVLGARRSMRRPTGEDRELLESRLAFAQRDLRFATTQLADTQALPGHWPSKPARVAKATADMALAQVSVELAELNLELAHG